MLQEVTGALSEENNLELSKFVVNRCTTDNCCGFSYAYDVKCTICGKIISQTSNLDNERKRGITVEQIGTKKRIIVKTDHAVALPSSFAFHVVVVSLGKTHVFDSRKKPCVVSRESISFGVYLRGDWVPVSVKMDEVEELLFSETVQVMFLRLKNQAFNRISESLDISHNHAKDDKMKRIVIVLQEKPKMIDPTENSNIPPYLTIPQLEVFCTNVRLSGGVCVPDMKPSLAQNLLAANGVRLSRNNPVENNSATPKSSSSSPCNGSDTQSARNLDSPMSSSTSPQNLPTTAISGELDDNLVILSDDDDEGPSSNETDNGEMESETAKEPEVVPHKKSKMPFVYQPPGSTDGIQLTESDVACLLPGSYLNDAIINFYLKYLFYEQLSQFQRNTTHFFNCFFYSRLSSVVPGPSEAQNNEAIKMQRHAGVAKWTRRVDIFSKDYVIIPINENCHWFVGLVCYPWMAGMVSYTQLYENFAFDLCQLTPDFVNVDQLPVSSPHIGLEELSVLPTDSKGEAFDRWRRRRLAWLRRRGINAMPCILIFDSIPTYSRVANLHLIRNYLEVEWNSRRSERDGVLNFNKDTVRGFSPRVPAQSNLVDCGIFLLHYVEMFFKKPVKNYTKDYFQNDMSGWFESEVVGRKREVIGSLIEGIMRREDPPS